MVAVPEKRMAAVGGKTVADFGANHSAGTDSDSLDEECRQSRLHSKAEEAYSLHYTPSAAGFEQRVVVPFDQMDLGSGLESRPRNFVLGQTESRLAVQMVVYPFSSDGTMF